MIKAVMAVSLALLAATTIAWVESGKAQKPDAPKIQPELGQCGCPKGQVCCPTCNGGTTCARSYAFCPECPAP